MKKLIVIMLMVYLPSFAQDSLSTEFMRLYNEYRVMNQLPPLEYDMQLDSFALQRLIVSSAGISDCMVHIEKIEDCPDGRNLHFKFQPMVRRFNDSNSLMTITGENMAAGGEYAVYWDFPERTFWDKVNRFFIKLFGGELPKSKPIYSSGGHIKIPNPASTLLKGWIESPGHNRYLLNKENTHFAFRIYRTTHFGRIYLHSVFIGGIKKSTLTSR